MCVFVCVMLPCIHNIHSFTTHYLCCTVTVAVLAVVPLFQCTHSSTSHISHYPGCMNMDQSLSHLHQELKFQLK